MPKKKTRPSKKRGWAQTKYYPHARHPAYYRKNGKDNDSIEYLTFTHHEEVKLGEETVSTKPLTRSVSKKERELEDKGLLPEEQKKSYVYPRVFQGKRSALGKETDEFEPVAEDAAIIDSLFSTLEKQTVPAYGGKGKLKSSPKEKNDPVKGVKTVPQSKDTPKWRDQVRSSKNEQQRSTPSKSSIHKSMGLSSGKSKNRRKK